MPQLIDPLSEILSEDPTVLIFYFAAIFLASYLIGQLINRLTLNKIRERFSRGLAQLDPNNKARAIGTKVLSFSGNKLTEQISQYGLAVIIVGRENPITWSMARLAGRVDMAILRAKLVRTINTEVDIIKKGSPAHRQLKQALSRRRNVMEGEDAIILPRSKDHQLQPDSQKALQSVRGLEGFWSISLRKSAPQLVVNFSPKYASVEQVIRAASSSLVFFVD